MELFRRKIYTQEFFHSVAEKLIELNRFMAISHALSQLILTTHCCTEWKNGGSGRYTCMLKVIQPEYDKPHLHLPTPSPGLLLLFH